MLTITKTILDHASGAVHDYTRETVETASGPRAIEGYVALSEADVPLNSPAWSNADLAAAVAGKLGIAGNTVTVGG